MAAPAGFSTATVTGWVAEAEATTVTGDELNPTLSGRSWTAPLVQANPEALAVPRWSVVGQRAVDLPPICTEVGSGTSEMPGLPGSGSRVSVGPPLAASAPRSAASVAVATSAGPPCWQVPSPTR